MAHERRHKSRSRRRRGRFSFVYKLLSLLLAVAAVLAACMVFFRVNVVSVTGNVRYAAQEIVDASGIQTGDNLVTLPKGRISSRILLGLPYVRSVSISRVLPDGVLLTVTEHTAAAAVFDGGSWWYLSAQGKLLETAASARGAMSLTGLTPVGPALGDRLAVSEEETGRLEYVLSLLSALEERQLLGDCAALDCSTAGVLWLDYLGFRLKLPTTGDFPYLLTMLEEAFATGRVSQSGAGTFDFTVADGKVYYSPS